MIHAPSRLLWVVFAACWVAVPLTASSNVTITRDSGVPCVGDIDWYEAQVDEPYTSITWDATGPAGSGVEISGADVSASLLLPRSGSYTVRATAALAAGGTAIGTLTVVVPRPTALVVIGSPGELPDDGNDDCGWWASLTQTNNYHHWCWMKAMRDKAVEKLEAAGWSVVALSNASAGDIEVALQASNCIEGIWLHAHGDPDGMIGLSQISGAFTDNAAFRPTDLHDMLVLAGQYRVRKITVMACNQDINDWKNAIPDGADEAFGPYLPVGWLGMSSWIEYPALDQLGHGIWSPDLPSDPAPDAPQSITPAVGSADPIPSCVLEDGPFPDYEFIYDRSTLGLDADPWAPQACGSTLVFAGTPTTINSPDGLWSVKTYAHGAEGTSLTVKGTSRSRSPGVSDPSDMAWRYLFLEVLPGGDATLDSMQVTIGFTASEWAFLSSVDPSNWRMFWGPPGPNAFPGALPVRFDAGTRTVTATVRDPGPGVAVPAWLATTGVPSPTSGVGSMRLVVAPNPTNGNLSMGLDLERPGLIEIEVFTAQGTRVAREVRGALRSGQQQQRFALPAGLAPGIYLVRVTSPRGSAVARVTLLR